MPVHSEGIWGVVIAWVTVGHLRVIIGHLRVTIGHLRVIKGHLRVIKGHLRVSNWSLGEHNWASPQGKANLLSNIFFRQLQIKILSTKLSYLGKTVIAWCAEWGSWIKFFFSELFFRTKCGQTGRIAADFSLHPSHIPNACMVLHSGSVVQYARVCGPSVPVLLLRCLLVLTCNPASRVTVYLDSGGLCSDTSQGLHMSTRHLD